MQILLQVVNLVVMIAILLGGIVLGRKFVFSKIRINKFIPLAIAIVFLIGGFFLNFNSVVLQDLLTIIGVIFFSWFIEITQGAGAPKEDKIKIRPKAKPNRVKNRQKKD